MIRLPHFVYSIYSYIAVVCRVHVPIPWKGHNANSPTIVRIITASTELAEYSPVVILFSIYFIKLLQFNTLVIIFLLKRLYNIWIVRTEAKFIHPKSIYFKCSHCRKYYNATISELRFYIWRRKLWSHTNKLGKPAKSYYKIEHITTIILKLTLPRLQTVEYRLQLFYSKAFRFDLTL